MEYRKALQLAAAADHTREQAELARAAVSRVEDKLNRLRETVTATEQALEEARRSADEADQVAERAASEARSVASGSVADAPQGENVTVTAQSAGAAGGAHQEG